MHDKARKALPELTYGFLFPINHVLCVLVAEFMTQRKAVHFFLDSKWHVVWQNVYHLCRPANISGTNAA